MAFNGIGSVTISGGAATGVWISYGGKDEGAQWIMADPIGPGSYRVTDMTKTRQIQVPNSLSVIYTATVTNVGEDGIFTLQGGGNV